MAPMSGKTKPSKAPVASEDSDDEVPLSEVAKKTTAPTPLTKPAPAKMRRRSLASNIYKESSEDLSEDENEYEDRAGPIENLLDVEDSEDDYENLTMDDEEFEATKELRKFSTDGFKVGRRGAAAVRRHIHGTCAVVCRLVCMCACVHVCA